MARYIALIDGRPGAFSVFFPDLPGCYSQGATLDEAHANAIEAARLWIETAIEDGKEIPSPRSMEKLRADPKVRRARTEGAVFDLAPALVESNRPTKANLSIDADILEEIDRAADERGLTRSAFLVGAAKEKIGVKVRAIKPSFQPPRAISF